MSSLIDVLIALIVVCVISTITYFTGKSIKRVNKNPFASGETVPPQRIQYLLPWLFSLIVFVAIDATLLLIAVSAPSVPLTAFVCLALVLLSFLLMPWGET